MTKMAHANHLINETSPYLLQHAFNPVEWYPWGPEALAQARKLNKPILLSIGYSACHWCHVMAHESFEDPETAALMNNLFINIKVDREERPDLDKIYQTAHYLLTQQNGGWPLTIFLTPDDLTPFFSGTYFPPETNYQLPAFKQVLKGLANFYQQKPEDIKQQNAQLRELLIKEEPIINDVHLNNQPIVHAIRTLQNTFDKSYGGFNGAPKFPQAPKLEFLLLNEQAIALQTLLKMAEGGIYDQIGGGFYRYAVDQAWQIPHFEKMLYDNAQLLYLYSLAAYHFNQPYFAHIALETAQWISTQMQDANGGYYSSLDADSEGHEGKFYVWDKEIEQHLFPEEYALIRLYYGLNKAPNFEGHWHLTMAESLATVADQLAMPVATAEKLLVSAKAKLVKVRAEREMPCLDDKILTGWNGLMIKGMISAGSLLKEPQFIRGAERALNFIRETLWKNNRLFATCRGGQVHLEAYLDDYVFMIDALLHYLQYRWDSELLSFATELMNSVLTHFMDEKGGFYFTANDHEKVLYRPKSMMDEAIPSGNGIAVRCLFLLGHLLGETRYLRAAEKTLHAAWSSLTFSPTEYCTLLIGLEEYLVPPQMIVIRGSLPEIKVWQENCASLKNYVFAIPHTETNLPGLLANMQGSEQACAYICEGTHCSAVISDLQELKQKVK